MSVSQSQEAHTGPFNNAAMRAMQQQSVRFVKSARPAQVCLAKVCIATIGVPLDFRTTKKHGAVGTMELANPNQRLGLTWSIRWLFSTGKVGLLLGWCHNKCWCEFSSSGLRHE